jgi:hypothetical protein
MQPDCNAIGELTSGAVAELMRLTERGTTFSSSARLSDVFKGFIRPLYLRRLRSFIRSGSAGVGPREEP